MKGNLIWKLLRQHVSIPQLAGFFLANLVGMTIILLGCQFYHDISPIFMTEDGLLKSDFVVVSKKVGAMPSLNSRSLQFSQDEIDELKSQGFIDGVGQFTTAEFKVDASMSIGGQRAFSTELPLESVPDEFIDVAKDSWTFNEADAVVPIILPRSYLAMYNFGFARSRALPQLSEGVVSTISIDLLLHDGGRQMQYKGRVIGFSGRLNAILVPQCFMEMANSHFAPDAQPSPTRLLVKTGDLAADNITQFIEDHGYEVENDRLEAEKTAFFLRLLVGIVVLVGIVISLLSFYILMLSVYLLVQKNADKLQTLLLIGHKPSQVALPYQLLTVGLNVTVLLIALAVVWIFRARYMQIVETLFPFGTATTMLPAVLIGLLLLLLTTLVNAWVIRRKIFFLYFS